MNQLLSNTDLRAAMQKQSDDIIEKFRFKNVAKGYLAAIEEGLKG